MDQAHNLICSRMEGQITLRSSAQVSYKPQKNSHEEKLTVFSYKGGGSSSDGVAAVIMSRSSDDCFVRQDDGNKHPMLSRVIR